MAVPCRFVSITGSDGHVIQRLLAVADRPPQLRFRHGDRQHGFVTPFGDDAIDGERGAEAGDRGMHRHRLTNRCGHLRET